MTLETVARNAAVAAVAALADDGSYLELTTTGDSVLATIALDNTPFEASPTTGVIKLIGDDGTTAISAGNPRAFTGTGAGTATKCKLRDSLDALIVTLTVGTSGTDVVLDNDVIAVDQVGSLETFSLTQPAS
jgi:hypothetical protein